MSGRMKSSLMLQTSEMMEWLLQGINPISFSKRQITISGKSDFYFKPFPLLSVMCWQRFHSTADHVQYEQQRVATMFSSFECVLRLQTETNLPGLFRGLFSSENTKHFQRPASVATTIPLQLSLAAHLRVNVTTPSTVDHNESADRRLSPATGLLICSAEVVCVTLSLWEYSCLHDEGTECRKNM